MIDIKVLNDLLVEKSSKYANTSTYQQSGTRDRYANILSTPTKDRYAGLLDGIDIEACIGDGYFAILRPENKMTNSLLAFIFGSKQEREDFVKSHPESKYNLTDFKGFTKAAGAGWKNINFYLIDCTGKVIIYNEEP